ncbi:MAG: hypothetical protein RLZZ332_340 [Actinomycetota bacterium]
MGRCGYLFLSLVWRWPLVVVDLPVEFAAAFVAAALPALAFVAAAFVAAALPAFAFVAAALPALARLAGCVVAVVDDLSPLDSPVPVGVSAGGVASTSPVRVTTTI